MHVDGPRDVTVWVAIVCGLALSVSSSTPSALAQESGPRVRVMSDAEQPIADRLRPTDQIVVIEPSILVAEPDHVLNFKETVFDATARADVVAVVDVDSVEGMLVRQDSWIETKLEGRMKQLLATSLCWKSRTAVGLPTKVYLFGGELTIRHVIVRAGNALRLPVHRQYLLFMRDDGAMPGFGITHRPLMIADGRLVDTFPPGPDNEPDALVGRTVKDVSKEIGRLVKSGAAPRHPATCR